MKGIFYILLISGLVITFACNGKRTSPISLEEDSVGVSPADGNYGYRDSFVVVYRQHVNGYDVKAVARLVDEDIISAELTFTKDGKSFMLHTQCFGDTLFSKGRTDYKFENPEIFKKYRNKLVEADYHENSEEEGLPIYTPFFFKDMDFDGIDELVIVHYSMAARYGNGYDVYRIVDGEPMRIDYPPYNDNRKEYEFGMTGYPEFDFKRNIISCPYPEGELNITGCKIYSISKTQKDTIVVKGKKYYFNHLRILQDN